MVSVNATSMSDGGRRGALVRGDEGSPDGGGGQQAGFLAVAEGDGLR